MKIIDVLKRAKTQPGDRLRSTSDDEVVQRAMDSLKNADLWLHAAMVDADRVFKRGSKPL